MGIPLKIDILSLRQHNVTMKCAQRPTMIPSSVVTVGNVQKHFHEQKVLKDCSHMQI